MIVLCSECCHYGVVNDDPLQRKQCLAAEKDILEMEENNFWCACHVKEREGFLDV